MNIENMHRNSIQAGTVKPLLVQKACGYQIVRYFAEVMTFQQVWDAVRSEFPEEGVWTIDGTSIPQALSTLSMRWGEVFRRCGAKPVLPLPDPVMYKLELTHDHSETMSSQADHGPPIHPTSQESEPIPH